MPSYTSIATAARHELDPILGSRFVADVAPAADAAEGAALVERVRAEFPDASHHCWAWRLPPAGIEFRYSDDGEPRGRHHDPAEGSASPPGRPSQRQAQPHER